MLGTLIPSLSRDERGFSILELMIVITLLASFFGAVYETVIVGIRSADSANDRETIRIQMMKTLDLLTREASAAYHVDNSTSSRFQFDMRIGDTNGDGAAENQNNINYQVVSGSLQRAGVTILSSATVTFTYLDTNGNATSTAGNVRVMQVTMSKTVEGETLSLSAATRLRNL